MYFALTKGIPTKNAFDERRWNKHDLRNARSLKESMDAVHGFCGLMAGFEGFIINEYVKKNSGTQGEEEDALSTVFQWGLCLLIISFILNVAAATASFLWGVFLREGHYRLWFMTVVGRSTKLMATGGVLTFCVGVLFFIHTVGLTEQILFAIYAGSALVFSLIMTSFLYTMIKTTASDPPDMYTDIMDAVN